MNQRDDQALRQAEAARQRRVLSRNEEKERRRQDRLQREQERMQSDEGTTRRVEHWLRMSKWFVVGWIAVTILILALIIAALIAVIT